MTFKKRLFAVLFVVLVLPSFALADNTLKVKNLCDNPIRIAVRYKDYDGDWLTTRWIELERGEKHFITTKNRIYYVAVEDDELGTDKYYKVEGVKHGFRRIRVDLKSKIFKIRHTCGDY